MKPIDWELPAGWSESPDPGPSQFGRYKTIQVAADDPSLVVAVNVLQGNNPGDLVPNLNRWEGQLGLPPTAPQDAPNKAKPIDVDGHSAYRIDLSGTPEGGPTRLLGVVIPEGGTAWSILLKGPADKVAAHESAFNEFVSSVNFPGHQHDDHSDAALGPPPGAQTQPADLRSYTLSDYTLPSGWVKDPTERRMRFATFTVGTGNEQTQVIVTKLPGGGFGSILQNVNRWRNEVGLPNVNDVSKETLRQMEIAGAHTVLFDFAGPPADAGAGAKRSFVAMLAKGADVWFFKLIGPAGTVGDQKANFESFLQTLKFGEASE